MKQFIIISFAFFMLFNANAQINKSDSTVQVIAYWDINETQSYTISSEKFRVQGADTISRDMTRYEVDITIIDSTSNSYVVNWFYRDYVIESDNELVEKLSSIVEDMNVQIKTDELGTLIEVINWKDIRKYIKDATSLLKKEMKDVPNMDKLISQIEGMYSSKEAIEASAIDEINQFYYFFGVKYKLWEELSYKSQLPNMFGGEPFDTEWVLWLDEINFEDNNSVFWVNQVVDSVQLTNETFKYLVNMAETLETPPPKREEFPFLTNETNTGTRIHESGWLLYSVETKEVKAQDVIQVEKRIIDLQ